MALSKLQLEAKSLGLKYVGISKNELKSNVAAALDKNGDPKEPVMAQEDSNNDEDKIAKPQTTKAAIAVVMQGKREIRRYTLAVHGSNFASLAEQFASKFSKKGYNVQMKEARMPDMKCPNCGFKFVAA